MKGKKFEAAEKHFNKKRVQYEAKIKGLEEQVQNTHCENNELKKRIEDLIGYAKLTEDDIINIKRMNYAINFKPLK